MTLLWRSHLIALGLTMAILLTIFASDVIDMVTIWWNASTYTHCLFIIPIVGWLIWQRKDEVAALPPRGWLPGLVLMAAGGMLWMVGEAAGVALFRHTAIVVMMQATVITLLGRTVARGIMFPLFYLFFLVPFGDEFVPMLQTITAKLCMFFLALTGIPAQIDGVFISISSGLFEVAEACSGIKFLVAMVAYGTLAANVCFKSWKRRIAFMTLAVVTPIIANGLRAFGTIYISHLTTNEFAAGFDHVIYGWFFFGFVMILVMAISWKFFDRSISDPWIADVQAGGVVAKKPVIATVIAVLALAAVPVAWASAVAASGRVAMPTMPALPQVKGWVQVPIAQSYPWWPRFDGADYKLIANYENAQGQQVELAVALFAWQDDGREIVGYGQGAFDPNTKWSWASDSKAPQFGRAARIFAPGAEREVVSFYVLERLTTGDPASVKLETLKTRIIGGDQAAVAVLVSAEERRERPARAAIDTFLTDLGSVDALSAAMVMQARAAKR